jgi:hypothetical protein
MDSEQTGFGPEKISALCSELQNLSGRFGNTQETKDGYLVSNDEGYTEIDSLIKEKMKDKNGGIALSVGTGGLLSLLPDLPVDVAIMADIDPSIFRFNKLLAEKIMSSNTPYDVKIWLSSNEITQEYPNQYQILEEAKEYGNIHWTDPERFKRVKEALQKKPIIYIAVDITSPDFAQALTQIADTYSEQIRFANFTNVAQYVESGAMDVVSRWPFTNDAAIIFSSKKDVEVGHYPKMRLANNLQEYIEKAKQEPLL